ncbi:MAG: tripartite tricarboxylate transporter substrate binding protein [Betaproteobacteria bacterium]|jgi:tripartite-type tricarboxylate transporter receptor subunit TctC|nr:tripartite tricarboxylate transporter substrate binding protein [Betaproteobacteria bacterium]
MTPRFLHCLAGALLLATVTAQAQPYPAGPIRIVVPFPAGGGVDTAGRLLGQRLAESLGRPVVIDNRAGANGMIGSETVAKAPRDGYTLMVNGANFVTSPSLYAKPLYDPLKDFEAISLLAHAPNIVVVHPSLPVKSIKELIAFAKARPGEILFAGSGSGSTPHLAGELFRTLTGTKMVHVPYRGTGPAITAILSGEVSTMFMPALTALPLIQSNRLRALAVTSLERLPALPELPTVSEAGLKGYQSSQWYGLLAPAGTPADILNLLNSHSVKIMQSAEMKERMKNSGSVAVGSSREVFAKFLQAEFVKWARVIKESGATVD